MHVELTAWQEALIISGGVLLTVVICCVCMRQRSQFTIQRRREARALQFQRNVADIRADLRDDRNALSFVHPSSPLDSSMNPSFHPAAYDDMSDGDRTVYGNKCNAIQAADIDSLGRFYESWLTLRKAPCYVLAFVNAKSGNQSAEALIREFKR